MNQNVIFSFIAGAVLGAGVSYVVVKKKASAEVDKEVASVKKLLDKNREADIEKAKAEGAQEAKIEINKNKPDPEELVKREYGDVVDYNQYRSLTPTSNKVEEGSVAESDIKPIDESEYLDEYSNDEGVPYDKFQYFYTIDKKLVDDETGEILPKKDIKRYVGRDFAKYFTEEDSSDIFFRNNALKADICVSLSERTAAELQETAYGMEGDEEVDE